MDSLEDGADALWSDLSAAALQPIDVSEIADLFAVVRRGARSRALAERLGPAHAVVRLADAVVAGCHRLSPERSALVVIVGAYLAEPSLSERWFGYSIEAHEAVSFAARALAELGPDLDHALG